MSLMYGKPICNYNKHHFNELGMLMRVMQDNIILKEVTHGQFKIKDCKIMILFKLKKKRPPNTIR